MNSITQNKRYCPHEITTKIKSVKLYRQTKDISFVCRRYHISKASLMRWNKLYDGTRDSVLPKSHRPLTPHPNAHTEEELKWIRDYHRRNPNISISELYGKLREKKAYTRHPGSLYRVFVRLGYRQKAESTKKKSSTTANMTRRPSSGRNGKWMSNMCRQYAIPEKMSNSSINIRSLKKHPENVLSLRMKSKAAILLWISLKELLLSSDMHRMTFRQITA